MLTVQKDKTERKDRVILHCDCNSFYASVESYYQPSLKTVPMAVCGNPENRHGIILAKNELAKKCGVETAETIWQAKRKCPDLILVPPHHDYYEDFSRRINAIYEQYTDLVEPFSIDESYLDVTGSQQLFGDGKNIADELRRRVREEIGVTISVGVSFNKVFAKLGSDYKKPDATTLISRENYSAIVYPLPSRALLYVGAHAEKSLADVGIFTVGDIARCRKDDLVHLLGKMGEELWIYANGLDTAPVIAKENAQAARSVGNGMTFRHNLIDVQEVSQGIFALSDSVASRLRMLGVRCRSVQLTIRDPNFKTITRQKQLEQPSCVSGEIAHAAMELFSANWRLGAPIRMLTVTGQGLTDQPLAEQMSLFAENNPNKSNTERREKLELTMDHIRQRFGSESVKYGNMLSDGREDSRKKEDAKIKK